MCILCTSQWRPSTVIYKYLEIINMWVKLFCRGEAVWFSYVMDTERSILWYTNAPTGLYQPLRNLNRLHTHNWQVEQKPGGRGRGREWATLGVHPLSWLLSNNRLEKVPFVSVPHTSSNRLLLSNQDKGCTPSVAHSLVLPLGPALLNLWSEGRHKIDYTYLIRNEEFCSWQPV